MVEAKRMGVTSLLTSINHEFINVIVFQGFTDGVTNYLILLCFL